MVATSKLPDGDRCRRNSEIMALHPTHGPDDALNAAYLDSTSVPHILLRSQSKRLIAG